MMDQELFIIIAFGLLLPFISITGFSEKSVRDSWNCRINGKLSSAFYRDKTETGFKRYRRFNAVILIGFWLLYLVIFTQYIL